MKRGSIVGPLLLITIGVLFLLNNLQPDLSLVGLIARFWPYVLIGWGGLRLLEILYMAVRRQPLPVSGVSGGEWTMIVLLSIVGSGVYMVSERVRWSPATLRMKGIEVFGKAYDYPLDAKQLAANGVARVVVDNAYGNARIFAGTNDRVEVSGRRIVRAYNSDEAEKASREVKVTVEREGDAILIRSLQDGGNADYRSVSTDLEITVPAAVRVEARGRRGDFDIHGIRGSVEIESDNAGVRLAEIAGPVRVDLKASDIIRAAGLAGTLEVRGFGRDIDVENVAGQVTVDGTYYGELQFRNIAKPVRYEGNVRNLGSQFQIAACPGSVRVSRGDLTMDDVVGPVVVAARSKDIQISGFTESLELKVERGDVELRPNRSPLPRINATTDSGNVEVVLPDSAGFEIRATADQGAIHSDFEDVLNVVESGRGKRHRSSLTGKVGNGPLITVHSERGDVAVRKGSMAEPPIPPKPPEPVELKIERH